MGMKTRGVTFNMEDPEQKKLLDYTLNLSNFSGYIKELIRKDRELKMASKEKNRSMAPGTSGIKIRL